MFTYFRALLVVELLLAHLSATSIAAAAAAVLRPGDIVSMSYRSKVTGSVEEKREAPWEEALRSQMPRFGRPDTVQFKPNLPDGGTSHSADRDQVAVVFAFFQEQFVLRRVMLREEGSGNEEGRRLKRLVVTFACAGGEIVKIRSDPVYACRTVVGPLFGGLSKANGDTAATATAGGEDPGFQVEYRWDHLPEEDAQAGLWFLLFASLVVTAVLAVDVCNSTAEDRDRVGMSGSRGGDGRAGAAGPRVGGGGGVLRPSGGGDELRRRR
ncbi:unnamed protein product [Ectocarpus sp. CCAP 1310/34]|nr:unnamed protein product [Ectocarpus sp. CCAP 1310/34]